MDEYLSFILTTSTGETKSLRVNNPQAVLEDSAIVSAVNGIVDSNIFQLKEGSLAGIKTAKRVAVTRETLF